MSSKSAISPALPLLNLRAIAAAPASKDPYPHLLAAHTLPSQAAPALSRDFPDIRKTGFLPLSLLARKGSFAALIEDLEGLELSEILSDKLGLNLRDKPRMITV